jgi:hypothetical protein
MSDFLDDVFGPRPPRASDLPDTGQASTSDAELDAVTSSPPAINVAGAPAAPEPAVMPAPNTPHEREPKAILDHALKMAARGFRVFPITPGDKVPPKGLAWKIEATSDPAKIRAWWAFEPNYNYAVAAGEGTLIVDVDAAKNGYAALLDLDLPDTLTVKTPGGGEHRYYAGPDVQNSVDRIAPGIDIRSAGGYVVGPGSFFADPGGKKGYTGHYKIECDASPATAPAWLPLLAGEPNQRSQNREPLCEADLPENVEWVVRNYLTVPPEDGGAPIAIEGRGGNSTAYAVFACLRERGISAGRSVELAEEHWNSRCVPPWSHGELVVLAANADAYGQCAFGEKAPSVLGASFGPVAAVEAGLVEGSAEWQAMAAAAEERDRDERMARLRASLVQAKPDYSHHVAVPCVVEHLAWRGEVTMFWGPGSAGKSLFVEAMLPAFLAAGRAIGRFRVPEPARTLVLNTEDTESETLSRAVACAEANGIDAETARDGLLVMKRDAALEFSVADYGPFKQVRINDRGIGDLTALARELGVRLIVLDPLSNLHGLDDNSAADMSVVLKAMRRLARDADAAVILLLHTNKAGLDSPGDPAAMGGSGKLTTGVRKTVSFFPARPGGKKHDDPPNADGADAAGRFPMHLDKLEAKTWVRMDDAKANRGHGATTWLRIGTVDLPVINLFGEREQAPVMTLAYDRDAVAANPERVADAAREFPALDDADYERFKPLFEREDGRASDLALTAITGLGVDVFRREQPLSGTRGPKPDSNDLAETMVAAAVGWDRDDPETALRARALLEWLVRTGRAERRRANPTSHDGRRRLGETNSIRVKPDSQGDGGPLAAIAEAIRKGPPARENGSAPRGGYWVLDNGRSANSIHLAFAAGMGVVRGSRIDMGGRPLGLTEKDATAVDGAVRLWISEGRLAVREMVVGDSRFEHVELAEQSAWG